MAALFVVGTGAAVAAFVAWRGSRSGTRREQRSWAMALVAVVVATVVGVAGALALLDTTSTTGLTLSSDVLALLGLAALAVPAALVLRARDPRRFVLGVLAAAVVWLVLWYPNIAALPLPADFASLYQGLLPTWNWDFQFAVNLDPASDSGLIGPGTFVIGGIVLVFVTAVAATARHWGGSREIDPPSR